MYRFIALVLVGFLFVGCQSIRNVHSFWDSNNSLAGQFTTNEVEELVKSAKRYIGVPYAGGGSNENGMDCSGLLFRVYVDNHFSIPRSSLQQSQYGLLVSKDNIQRGDWLLFKTNGSITINHIGLV